MLVKIGKRCSFPPGRQFFLDNYSRTDWPAVTELRRTTDGKLISVIDRADITNYRNLGIRLPEVFVAKGRGGVTDIWGIVCRPPQFDSTKKYPVIAGPQDKTPPEHCCSIPGFIKQRWLISHRLQVFYFGTFNLPI